jgi:DNA primase
MSKKKDGRILKVDAREIEISNPDKILFPHAQISKAELIEYYSQAAEHMLPYLRERPISMERYPDGIDSAEAELKEGGSQFQVVCSNRAALVYLADQACLTPHVWLSRAGDVDRPDRMIFDPDPSVRDAGTVPIDWEELSSAELRSDAYSIKNIFRRLTQKDDPWADFTDRAAPLSGAVKRLDQTAGLEDLNP